MIDRILENKLKYNSLYILKFEDESSALFRSLNWSEFKAIRDILFSYPSFEFDIKEYLFKKCILEYNGHGGLIEGGVVSKYFYELVPAGVISTIADAILRMSGPVDISGLFSDLEATREYAPYAAEERILSLVASVSSTKISDMDKMNWTEIKSIIAQSELIMTSQYPEIPFRLAEQETGEIDFAKENRDLDNA